MGARPAPEGAFDLSDLEALLSRTFSAYEDFRANRFRIYSGHLDMSASRAWLLWGLEGAGHELAKVAWTAWALFGGDEPPCS